MSTNTNNQANQTSYEQLKNDVKSILLALGVVVALGGLLFYNIDGSFLERFYISDCRTTETIRPMASTSQDQVSWSWVWDR